MKLTGENISTRRKTCPSATLSTTNPKFTNPGSNPGLRGGRQATNRLSVRFQHKPQHFTNNSETSEIKNLRFLPIPVAARSKASVCVGSLVGIVGSNPVGGVDVCLL
jgi:hypothetical protein